MKNFIEKVGRKLLEDAHAEYIVVTQGKQGMTLFSNNSILNLPTFAKDVFDVTRGRRHGHCSVVLGLERGLGPLPEACILANHAAGYVVSQLGCVTCTRENPPPGNNSHSSR
ncbi:MAG: hypothetical protein R2827_16460 [Bdellovibrionales bacterium]